MTRACSSAPRISARLDFPAPIGPSTAMYRGLTVRTRSLYPAGVLRGYQQFHAGVRGARLLGPWHAQPGAHRPFGAAREGRVERRRRFGGRLRHDPARVDLDLQREAEALARREHSRAHAVVETGVQ